MNTNKFKMIITILLVLLLGGANLLFSAELCSPTTIISVPFTKDGVGDVCLETTSLCTSINSWNLTTLEINGTSYLNTFVNSSTIPAVSGKYVIHYVSTVAWGHFEIAGACSSVATATATTVTRTATATSVTRTATATATTVTRTATATTVTRTATATATTVTRTSTATRTATTRTATATRTATSVTRTATATTVTRTATATTVTRTATLTGTVSRTATATATPIVTGGSLGPTKTNTLGAGLIRVNQAGYNASETYKVAYVANLTGTFQVLEYGTNTQYLSGTLVSRGTDTVLSETIYTADFSSLTRAGKYYVKVGVEWSPSFVIKDDLYNEVLYYTLRVYGANRCGPYDSWIHSACHTLDGSIRGTGKEGSLVGGWHDCGDHVKFGTTLGYAVDMMLFAYNAFPNKFGDVYSMSYNGTYKTPSGDGIPDILNEAKVGTDYLLNLYNASVADGLISANKMYYQVGDGDDDHTWWHKPEYQDSFGQAKGGAPRELWSDIGSDIAGRYVAALAMMSIAYKPYDATYATNCLNAAKAIYPIIAAMYGLGGDTGGKGYYQPDGRMDDDAALAAVEMYKATLTASYLTDAAYWMAKENKWQFVSYYVLSYPNIFALVLYDYYAYASTVDNDPSAVDTLVVTKAECIEWLKLDASTQLAQNASDPYGRAWNYGWGTCRYMMGIATTAALAYSLDNTAADMLKIAKDQMNWIFGCNQFGMSFVVGNKTDSWLTKYPQHPHHRAANPDGTNVPELPPYTATELTGGTIGGPSAHTTFSDVWDDYTSTETGIDYWAGTFVTAAIFAKAVN